PEPSSLLYPAGFTVEADAIGAKYFGQTLNIKILNFSAGQLRLSDGGLPQPLTNHILFNGISLVTSPNGVPLAFSLSPQSGLFKGSVINPATGRRINFNGAVLQKQNAGYGCFLDANQSGAVYFGP